MEPIIVALTTATLALGILVKYGWPVIRGAVKFIEMRPTLEAIAEQFKGGNGKSLRQVVDEIHAQGEERSARIEAIEGELADIKARLGNVEQQAEQFLTGGAN